MIQRIFFILRVSATHSEVGFSSVKGYCVSMINKTIHGCLKIWSFFSRVQLEKKFHIYARTCIILYLSRKLRCYTDISGPEKSRNNTREKISYFFTCVDIANLSG